MCGRIIVVHGMGEPIRVVSMVRDHLRILRIGGRRRQGMCWRGITDDRLRATQALAIWNLLIILPLDTSKLLGAPMAPHLS